MGPKKKAEFVPLDKRKGNALNRDEYWYAFKMQSKHEWLIKYTEKFETTICALLTDEPKRKLFAKALDKFVYINRDQSGEHVMAIANQISDVWKCNVKESVVVAFKKKTNFHPDGSNVLLYHLQDKLQQWPSTRFLSDFDIENKWIKNSKNIILCDDFIGTGGTMENRISDLVTALTKNQRIYIVALGAMSMAKDRYKKYKNVEVFSPVWIKNGVCHLDNTTERSTMLDIERGLAPEYKNYSLKTMSLGYLESGALYFNEEYRIPNNVYPIFWWGKLFDKTPFNSIFLRS